MTKKISIFVLIALCLIVSGCAGTQPKPWGNGELPADYVAIFGDDNTARLNKAQNDLLNKHEALLMGLDGKTADGKPGHQNGIIDMLVNLDTRLKALETVDLSSMVCPDKEGQVRYIYTDPLGNSGQLEFHNGNDWVSLDKLNGDAGLVIEDIDIPTARTNRKAGRSSN